MGIQVVAVRSWKLKLTSVRGGDTPSSIITYQVQWFAQVLFPAFIGTRRWSGGNGSGQGTREGLGKTLSRLCTLMGGLGRRKESGSRA